MRTISNRIWAVVFLALGLMLVFTYRTSAQTIPGTEGFGDYVSIQKSPEHPGPHTDVRVRLESSSVNLTTATITWTIDGRVAVKDIGVTEHTIRTKALGSPTSVAITIVPLSGALIQRTLTIRPASVALIWEAISYTPPLYRGKKLNAFDGRVRLIALPEFASSRGGTIAPANLVYTWKKNGMVEAAASGYGKNTFIPAEAISFSRGESTFEVTVATPDGTTLASDSVIIRPFTPAVLLYENNPLLGIRYDRALSGTFTVTDEETVFAASPYFFSIKERSSPSLNYTWSVNGQIVFLETSDKSLLRVRGEGKTGTSQIELVVQKINALFQEARVALSVLIPER